MKEFTRREFLGRTAAAVGAAPVFSQRLIAVNSPSSVSRAPSVPGSVSPNEKVQVALIGCGGMGRGDLATFFTNPEVDCPIICDVDDAQLAKTIKLVEEHRGHQPDAVKDFRRVIDRNDVDVCLVATPDHWHALPTVYACQAGKDVYVEKPLAKSIEEGRAMVEAARQHRRVVQMGTQWRSGDHYREAVEFVQSGRLGTIRLVRAWAYLDWVGGIGSPPDSNPPDGVDYDMWLGPAPKRPFNPNRFHFNFRWFWDYAGGLMTDWGVHLLNVCLWAMGYQYPLRASSLGGKRVVADNTETPDTQVTIYKFPTYDLIFEHQTAGGIGPLGRPHGMAFWGSEAALVLDANGWEVISEPKKQTIEALKKPGQGDGRPAHVRNFLDCLKSRQQPVQNPDVGHLVSTVAHLGNIAFLTGTEVVWDAATQRVSGNRQANRLVRSPYRKPWHLDYMRP